jgi:hypothetical protein
MRQSLRILALRLDLGGMQEGMPASCRLARMIGDLVRSQDRKTAE